MKKIVILGGGESGVGAALLAKHNGCDVFVSEGRALAINYRQELIANDIPFEENGHNFDTWKDAHTVVKSPGIPYEEKVVLDCLRSNMNFISEIEWGSQFYKGKILAITGSNGKTTSAGLLFHTMYKAGLDVVLGGNYGKSFCRILTESNPEYMVLELSSFQLDDCFLFKPHVAALLNITADHLDRYDYQMEKYADAKVRIAQSQSPKEILVINADDQEVIDAIDRSVLSSDIVPIKEKDYINGVLRLDGTPFELSIIGRHNRFNARVVVEMCRCIGMSEDQIGRGLSTFVNQPHRLEVVKQANGINYINDSKATNVDAVYYALEAVNAPIVWIAGGTDKGNEYSVLDELVTQKVRSLICLGIDNAKLLSHFAGMIDQVQEVSSIADLMIKIKEVAREGDTILLSPACASFDLFKNYVDRGDQFRAGILNLN